MTDNPGRQAGATRLQILRAAAHQFATRPYHDVGLDDILADAELTKGAMYFHFRSKRALATAIVEQWGTADSGSVSDLLGRKLSGLETLVDLCYQVAIDSVGRDEGKAVLHLLGSLGQTDGLREKVVSGWVETVAAVITRAAAEGDVTGRSEPLDIARVIVSMYLGMRQTSNLDEPARFLGDLQKNLTTVLPGFVSTDRVGYFTQFVQRRTALAIRTADRH